MITRTYRVKGIPTPLEQVGGGCWERVREPPDVNLFGASFENLDDTNYSRQRGDCIVTYDPSKQELTAVASHGQSLMKGLAVITSCVRGYRFLRRGRQDGR